MADVQRVGGRVDADVGADALVCHELVKLASIPVRCLELVREERGDALTL